MKYKRVVSSAFAVLTLLMSCNLLCTAPAAISAECVISRKQAEERFTTMSSVQQKQILSFYEECGISSPKDHIISIISSRRSIVDESKIKDINSDGHADIADAQCIVNFLCGTFNYSYEYYELDVTGDYVVSIEDAVAYLNYYLYYYAYYNDHHIPSSSHGPYRTVNSTFDTRSYTRCSYPSMTNSQYTITLDGTVSYPQSVPTPNAFSSNCIDNNETDAITDTPNMTPILDSRIVRIGVSTTSDGNTPPPYSATGFIVGKHIIATAAHCVYNSITNQFYPKCAAYAVKDNNGDGIITPDTERTVLTVKNVDISSAYSTASNSEKWKYDYALVEVDNDLSDFGKFSNLGMLLDDNPNSYLVLNPFTVRTCGFYGYEPTPEYITGDLYQVTPHVNGLTTDLYGYGIYNALKDGMSGSASFLSEEDEWNNDVAIGIYTSNGSYTAQGLIFSRPLIQFYKNNPALTY